MSVEDNVQIEEKLINDSIEEQDENEELNESTMYKHLEELPTVDVCLDSSKPFCSKFFQFVGPGVLMSMAQIDPGNLAGDMDAGQSGKYALLWVLFLATIAGGIFQFLAIRLGIVTGLDLASNIQERQNKAPRLFLWIMTEIAIIGSDIQEVIGTAVAIKILTSGTIPLWGGILITILDTFIFMGLSNLGIHQLEVFFACIITVMCVCFWANTIMIGVDSLAVLKGSFVPSVPKGAVLPMLGLVGSVIMPHNFYLHSALVCSRKFPRIRKQCNMVCKFNYLESAITLFISALINTSILCTFAQYSNQKVGLETAGTLLNDTLGPAGTYLWGIGLLASGQASTMTGAFAGQYSMQGFLRLNLPIWKRVLITRTIAIAPALVFAFLNNPDELDTELNILQAIQLPFAIAPLLMLCSDKYIMRGMQIGRCQFQFCLIVAIGLFGTNAYSVFPKKGSEMWTQLVFSLGIVVYVGLIAWVTFQKRHKTDQEITLYKANRSITKHRSSDEILESNDLAIEQEDFDKKED